MNKYKGLILPLLLLLFWYLLSISSTLIPSPLVVWNTTLQSFGSGLLGNHLLISVSRVISGVLIPLLFALPLAIFTSRVTNSNFWIDPLLDFARLTPALALLPLFLLWSDDPSTAVLMVIIISAFIPIFSSAEKGFRNADIKLIEVGKNLSLPEELIFKKIIFPFALPSLILGIRLGVTYSWRVLVASELLLTLTGLGTIFMEAHTEARADKLIMLILITGILGTLVDWFLAKIVSDWIPWHQEVTHYDGN
ncbi:MAG: ABC transporter permease subunit [Negativicutes bacterium]|nr:ABC transporter permease subunit [Negativicutes bacterium]